MNNIKIPFKGWDLIAWVNQQDGEARIAVKPVCEAIGINWPSQYSKLVSDSEFSCCDITTTGADGKQYLMTTLYRPSTDTKYHTLNCGVWYLLPFSFTPALLYNGLMFTQGFRKQANAVITAARSLGMQAAKPGRVTTGVSRAALNKAFPAPSSPATAVTDITQKAVKSVPTPGTPSLTATPSVQHMTRHVPRVPYGAMSEAPVAAAKPQKGLIARIFG